MEFSPISPSLKQSVLPQSTNSAFGHYCGRLFTLISTSFNSCVNRIKEIAKAAFARLCYLISFINRGIQLPEEKAAAWKVLGKWCERAKENDKLKIEGLTEAIPYRLLRTLVNRKPRPLLKELMEEKEIRLAEGQIYRLNGFLHIPLYEGIIAFGLTGFSTEMVNSEEFRDLMAYFIKQNNSNFSKALAVILSLKPIQLNLNLTGDSFLIDENMTKIGQCTSLRSLNLKGQSSLTSEGFKHLNGLTFLEKLDLSSCLIDDILVDINGLTNLESLNLNNNPITSLEPIKGLVKLKTLELAWTEIKSFEPVKNWLALERVKLSGCKLTGTDLSCFSKLPQLKELDLRCCEEIEKEWFERLADFQSLEKLYLEDAPIDILQDGISTAMLDPEFTKILSSFPGGSAPSQAFPRKSRATSNKPITEKMLVPLTYSKTLKELHITGCKKIKKDSLQFLAEGKNKITVFL